MTFWVAKLETRHFSLEAFGTNSTMATRALKDGIVKHCRQRRISFTEFMQAYNESITVGPRVFGGVYLDNEPL